jgi:hypothetical protein
VKHWLVFINGLVIGAVGFGLLGVFCGYSLAHSGRPAVIVRNATRVSMSEVTVETKIGKPDSYPLEPGHSHRIKVSSRGEQGVRITARTTEGRTLTSEEVYLPSEGIAFGTISEDGISIDVEL